MSAAHSRRLATEYAAWAEEHRLAEGEHDAAYAGVLSGVRVRIDTGVRDSGLYAVVVTIAIACGLRDVLVKRGRDEEALAGARAGAVSLKGRRQSFASRATKRSCASTVSIARSVIG